MSIRIPAGASRLPGAAARGEPAASSATIPGPDTSGLTSTSMPMTTNFPTRLHPTPLRVATVTLCLMLGGCTVVGDWFGSDHADYKNNAQRTQPLDVPPDLTQLQRDSRYLPQGGVVTASDLTKPGGSSVAGQPVAGQAGTGQQVTVIAEPSVALNAIGDIHLESANGQRWLTTKEPPEVVLPKVRDYWLAHGATMKVDDPKTGILETDWIQSKAALPGDTIHNLIGRFLDNLYDSGLRDRYRTRLERTADGGTEIYVSHFGATEELTGRDKSEVQWVPRPSDPGLEAQQLSQLLLSLGGQTDTNVAGVATAASAAAPADTARPIPSSATQQVSVGGTGPNGAMRARALPGQAGASLTVDDNFDRSWRRVGLALDHGGFTVEDRDRAQGLYYVRYVDAKEAAKEDDAGIMAKIAGFFGSNPTTAVGKYRIQIKSQGDAATVTVLNDQGQPDNGDNAQHIVALLVDELK